MALGLPSRMWRMVSPLGSSREKSAGSEVLRKSRFWRIPKSIFKYILQYSIEI